MFFRNFKEAWLDMFDGATQVLAVLLAVLLFAGAFASLALAAQFNNPWILFWIIPSVALGIFWLVLCKMWRLF